MATINYDVGGTASAQTRRVTWEALAAGDDGQAFAPLYQRDMSVQVTGTFGGATVTLEGSNDGTNWYTLNDPFGTALSFTAAGLEGITEHCWQYRPNITGGDGTVDIDVVMVVGGKE